MINYNRIAAFQGIDVNKSNESKECNICHYCYFLNKCFRFQTYVCNGCHDLLMMSLYFDDIAILNINGVDYRCVISGISKSEVVTLLRYVDLTEKSWTS